MVLIEDDIIDYCDIHQTEMVDDFKDHVAWGLTQPEKQLSCKYIYDENGSRLFQKICKLSKYYLTECERQILENNDMFFFDLFSQEHLHIIELGSGDGAKTKILLRHLFDQDLSFHYFPIDISCSSIEMLTASCKKEFQGMHIQGLVAEYFQGLSYLAEKIRGRKIVLFLGSNIGNLNQPQALSFLKRIWHSLKENDYLFIGFDLQKRTETLMAAYDDSNGITEQFHKNLLHRINSELEGEFDPDLFSYCCIYNPKVNAIQSYLISSITQEVYIKAFDAMIRFKKGESIHTESSYKYTITDIESLASSTGFIPTKHLFDHRKYFVNSLWQVKK